MTVSYNLDVSSVSGLSFLRLLLRWKGSIWKNVKSELILWIICYYAILVTLHFSLDDRTKTSWSKQFSTWNQSLRLLPLEFMLGFFVSVIADRWRQIFSNLGWIDNTALTVAAVFRGQDRESVLQRRTIIRYMVLSQVLAYRNISMRVRRRFPNLEAIVQAGFMLDHELKKLESIDIAYSTYWVPVSWALKIVDDAGREKKIESSMSVNNLIGEIRAFRANLAVLCNMDWVPLPIAYPQIVFLAVRAYFVICLVTRQQFDSAEEDNDVLGNYFPLMTILQFIFYFGWMKVAEVLLNPLGEDDDDFEVNFLIDKNLATGFAIVDTTFEDCPKMEPDTFMDKKYIPVYSEESARDGITSGMVGSVEGVELAKPKENVKMVAVTPNQSVNDLSARDRIFSNSLRLRHRFSPALPGKRIRSHSVQPSDFGESAAPNFGLEPSNEYPKKGRTWSETSDFSLGTIANPLPKVEEESASREASFDIDRDDENDVPSTAYYPKNVSSHRKKST